MRFGIVVFSYLVATTSAVAELTFFQGLGDLPGGSFESRASAVSGDGSTVVGQSRSASGQEAFRWQLASGIVGLGDYPTGGFSSRALGVSADGSVVVGEGTADITGLSYDNEVALRWSGGSMVPLGPADSFLSSNARDVSADGTRAAGFGYITTAGGYQAVRWDGTTMVGLGDLGGGDFKSGAYGISADGSVIVGWGKSGAGTEAFRWAQSGGMTGLGDLAGGNYQSVAYGVSADGSAVVGQSIAGAGPEAFRWTPSDGMVGIGDLPGGQHGSIAHDVSGDGAIVVGQGSSSVGNRAFIWDALNGMRNLEDVLIQDYGIDLAGWRLLEAISISDDGLTIVGTGRNPSGLEEAWIARIPEPGSASFMLIGILGFSALKGRRMVSVR